MINIQNDCEDCENVTRLEVIDYTASIEEGGGRSVLFWDKGKRIWCSLQDDNKTLKIFIENREE